MIEINASFRFVKASMTSYQASAQRDAISLTTGSKKPDSPFLSKQENQIVDDVGISNAAVKKFEELRALNEQLSAYLDYLKGRNDKNNVRLNARNDAPATTIQGRSTNIAASVTLATYKEESIDINAKFDNAGNLQEVSIDKTTITAKHIKADLLIQDYQFYSTFG